MKVPFNFDTYQKTVYFQFLHNKYSIWFQMEKYLNAKNLYYKGKAIMRDDEFDALEGTILALTSEEFLNQHGTVGYNKNQHLQAKILLKHFKNEINIRYTIPHNEHAEACHKSYGLDIKETIREIKTIEIEPEPIEVFVPQVFISNDYGQLSMF